MYSQIDEEKFRQLFEDATFGRGVWTEKQLLIGRSIALLGLESLRSWEAILAAAYPLEKVLGDKQRREELIVGKFGIHNHFDPQKDNWLLYVARPVINEKQPYIGVEICDPFDVNDVSSIIDFKVLSNVSSWQQSWNQAVPVEVDLSRMSFIQ